MLTIWVDGDSCPSRLRDIVVRAARRPGVRVVIVADRCMPVGETADVKTVVVTHGSGTTDDTMVDGVAAGDVAVTRDVKLAAELVAKGAAVLDDKGAVFTDENIGERLSIRRFMGGLREIGVDTGSSCVPSARETKAFSDALDRVLTAALNAAGGE